MKKIRGDILDEGPIQAAWFMDWVPRAGRAEPDGCYMGSFWRCMEMAMNLNPELRLEQTPAGIHSS